MTAPTWRKRARAISASHLATGLVLAGGGIVGLSHHAGYVLPGAVIAATDIYVFLILWCAARRASGRRESWPGLPWVEPAIILVMLLSVALVTAFGGIYLETGDVLDVDGHALGGHIDAIYFSTVTMTTLGYGDFTPRHALARLVVVAQLWSSLLLLMGAIPLLVGRIASMPPKTD